MANSNAPFGLRPLMRSITGGPGAASMAAHKLAGDGTALYPGDAVKKAASGTKNTPCVTAATAAAANYGVNLVYGKASTATDHIVIPGQSQVFLVQEDGTGNTNTGLLAADVDKNVNLVATAGDTTLLRSKHGIAGSTIQTTNTLDFHVLKLWEGVGNAFGQYAVVEITFNNSQLSNQVAGV